MSEIFRDSFLTTFARSRLFTKPCRDKVDSLQYMATLKTKGSLGLRVVMSRFGGMRGVKHPAYPQIWEPSRKIP